MRFLCLHGAGTSGEIFEIQSGGLTQPLESKGHKFIYINGRLSAECEPELKGICSPPFYNHYPRSISPGEDLTKAIGYTLRLIEREGPFDAVMGFSQGAALAYSLLLHHQWQQKQSAEGSGSNTAPLFKAAVFICGAAPYDLSGRELLRIPEGGEVPVSIPTAHIVGRLDPLYESSMELYRLCEAGNAELYDHGSKHMIPFDRENTDAMVGVIERVIERARRG